MNPKNIRYKIGVVVMMVGMVQNPLFFHGIEKRVLPDEIMAESQEQEKEAIHQSLLEVWKDAEAEKIDQTITLEAFQSYVLRRQT